MLKKLKLPDKDIKQIVNGEDWYWKHNHYDRTYLHFERKKKGSDDKLKTKCTNNNISYTDLQQPSRVDDEDNLLPTVGDSVRIIFQPFRVSVPGRK